MKSITLSKAEFAEIDNGYQLDFERFGFPMFAVPDEYGDYETPNGTKFRVEFYTPNEYILEVKSR